MKFRFTSLLHAPPKPEGSWIGAHGDGLALKVGERYVPIELRPSPRARRLSLRVDTARGVIRVSLHPRTSAARALALVEEHRDWIARRVAWLPAARPFAPGATIPIEGRDVRIDWDGARRRAASLDGDVLTLGGAIESLAARTERFLRARAKAVLEAETREIAARIGRVPLRVTVKDTSSRWGSCSAKGGIAYSWRLILAPEHVRGSVVAHEVAHLVHLNHGADFWRLAGELYGGPHDVARAWLKREGPGLHRVGQV